jgi:RNA polymerase sigma-70 factor, ECF subfamily
VVQDVFLAVWSRRRNLEVRGNVGTYLHVAVRNAAFDRLKHIDGVLRHRAAVATAMAPQARPPDSAHREREVARAVEAAIQTLPERAREVFIMSRNGGLSYAEIAAVLGVSVKAVEASMSRALRSLRTQLAPYLEEAPARVG